jgi:uncharacterized protein
MATALVDHPEQGPVSGGEGESSLVIEVGVAKAAIGKIMGKNGRMIAAMRTILHASRAHKAFSFADVSCTPSSNTWRAVGGSIPSASRRNNWRLLRPLF